MNMCIHDEPAAWDTVPALLADRVHRYGDALAYEVDGMSLGVAEIEDRAARLAGALAAMGVAKGDRVCSFLFDCMEQVIVFFATARLGAVWAPLNASLGRDDLAYTARDAGAQVMFTDADGAVKLDAAGVGPGELPRVLVGPDFDALLERGVDPPAIDVDPRDPAVVVYTGGTTGRPKGGVLSQFALVCSGVRYVETFEPTAEDRHYSILSLFHVGGLMIGLLGPLVAGIPAAIDKWFSASAYWRRVRETDATIIDPIGTMLSVLCRQPESPDDRRHRVRISAGVFAQIPESVPAEFTRRFGVPFVNLYSLTECGGTLIVRNTLDSAKPLANGRGHGWADIAILDAYDQSLPPGEMGEIALRATHPHSFMSHYHNAPERTAEIWRNGWVHTGDLGYLDEEGDLYFVGRQAHWLRRRGENVSAYEVEAVLSECPGVAEAIVVGVPAELGEDDVKAFVIADGEAPDPRAIVAHCTERLARFKVPRYVEFVDEFPRSATKNEVERHVLRARSNEAAWDAGDRRGR